MVWFLADLLIIIRILIYFLNYLNLANSQNDQVQIQILDEVNLQVVEQEQAIRQLEVIFNKYFTLNTEYFIIYYIICFKTNIYYFNCLE